MQVNMSDVYDNAGNIEKKQSGQLSGHKQLLSLLPNLQLLDQHLHSKTAISIYEEARQGLYFSFLGTSAIKTIQDIESVQISYQARDINGVFSIAENTERSLIQIRITPSHLAMVLGETENQIIQHFSAMQDKLANENAVIQLPLTEKTANIIKPILSHKGHSISLAGHLYAAIFTLIEQLQMLNHLSQCEECQSKLFNAQNLIEIPAKAALNIQQLAHTVGLNTDALAIGFHLLVGQSIESYCTHSRIKVAAAQLRQNPASKSHIVAQSGFSADQFEAAFIQHFGVSSHQYGQIH
ncbi:AraC family transcriptional regulator [Marinomonas sp. M1K-6]|uniref:AraC family transcriptional regulator n=1 Tax=Marinomonas profundi TaxID=2726122 RepID=A0A847QVY1_9GAMM|nr:AraC family transcriptional regulator [Marinomonas profundi]NLQ16069.1 AraC family transcriptional regulator [Marinomonas profundi]UDV03343.1 AraC family transcriptional regulator [Marinomonas profundi]